MSCMLVDISQNDSFKLCFNRHVLPVEALGFSSRILDSVSPQVVSILAQCSLVAYDASSWYLSGVVT